MPDFKGNRPRKKLIDFSGAPAINFFLGLCVKGGYNL